MNAEKIIDGLRYCDESAGLCIGCPLDMDFKDDKYCNIRLEAADLIESLQKQLNDMIDTARRNYCKFVRMSEELAESQRRERAAVEDLSTYKDCGFCIHVQDQQYCYKNCQRHVNVDNFRTHPCWQWRGPEAGE